MIIFNSSNTENKTKETWIRTKGKNYYQITIAAITIELLSKERQMYRM